MPNKYYQVSQLTGEHHVNGRRYEPTEEASRFEIRTQEVQEIMSRMPNIVIRQGTGVLFAIIVLLFAGAYFIQLPEIVSLPVRIRSSMEADGGFQAQAQLPLAWSGKIKPEQKAIIKLPVYPFQEFGVLEGRVKQLSAGASDTAYTVEIKLPNGLKTTGEKHIPAGDYLIGTAEIITSNKTIAERLFERVWKRP